jgi:iron complex transport system substrate-binding protein
LRHDSEMARARCARFVLALLCAFAAAGAPVNADAPRRVVSFNICADQLVVALADPGQIAGLSPYATDPTLSAVAEEARAFRRVAWHAESVVALEPDLVLVGARDRAVTQRMLAALGLRVVTVDLVGTIAAARDQIRQVAALLGQPARGESLLARLETSRARLRAAPRPPASTALLIGHGGYSEGAASLAAALIAEAGLVPPPGAPAGLGGFVPLESLVMMRPDLIVLHDAISEPRDQGSVYLTHPAVKSLYPPSRRIILPGRYTLCGGPSLIAGLDHLADALARLTAEPPIPR